MHASPFLGEWGPWVDGGCWLSIAGTAVDWQYRDLDRNFGPETVGGSTVRRLLIVDDPKSVLDCAVVAGTGEINPVGEEHGWQWGWIDDPFGHRWRSGGRSAEGRHRMIVREAARSRRLDARSRMLRRRALVAACRPRVGGRA